MSTQPTTVGVLAGICPDAAALFLDALKACPGRTELLLDDTPLPGCGDGVPSPPATADGRLGQAARSLQDRGAAVIVIPACSGHLYLDEIRAAVDIPVINIAEVLARRAVSDHPLMPTVGVITITPLLESWLFDNAFSDQTIALHHPDVPFQVRLMRALPELAGDSLPESVRDNLQAMITELVHDRDTKSVIIAVPQLIPFADSFDWQEKGFWWNPYEVLAQWTAAEYGS